MDNSSSSDPMPLRSRSYTVNKLDTIRSAIAGYAGGVAIARELVQNADDARSNYIEFHFTGDALEVRNGSSFSDDNLNDICRLASGSKRNDEETTGTWGTGFLSVYQITDYPELHSAGVHLTFDPERDELDEYPSPKNEGTVFRFPWRAVQTHVSRYIEADNWDCERIGDFQRELCQELYMLSPFLRNIRRLAVYSGTNRNSPVSEVRWLPPRHTTVADGSSREERDVLISTDDRCNLHKWVFYSSQIGRTFMGAGGAHLKKPDIRFAFGVDENGGLVSRRGILYNFLPTTLITGYHFHIQGDFFPDANRTTILTDTSLKAQWNRELIAGIACLFGRSLVALRDDAPNPQTFYLLLASVTKSQQPFLEQVLTDVKALAVNKPVILTACGSWVEPHNALLAGSGSLADLAKGHVPGIASKDDIPDSVTAFLGVLPYTFPMFLDRIAELTTPGTHLDVADPIVRGRERLDNILEILAEEHQKTPNSKLIASLKKAPVCLYHSGLLYPSEGYALYKADDEMRRLFEPQSLHMIDSTFQARHEQIVGLLGLKSVGFQEAQAKMKRWGDEYRGKPLTACPNELSTFRRIRDLALYFNGHPTADPAIFASLPLCPDTAGMMGCIGDAVVLADTETRAWLSKAGIRFISEDIERDVDYTDFLCRAGHPRFGAHLLVEFMPKWFAAPGPIQDAHPLFNRPAKWQRLIGFLANHSTDLDEHDVMHLKAIPFVPTQKENYTLIVSEHAVLKLPPRSSDPTIGDFSSLLEIDNLINTRYANRNIQEFLRNKLDISTLSIIGYIAHEVVRNYDRHNLSHRKRLDLLKMIWGCPELRSPHKQPIRDSVLQLSLIRCTDGLYRKPSEVYFPSETLDALLPYGYPQPHLQYARLKRANGPEASGQEEQWLEFLEWLGLRKEPLIGDIVDAINTSVSVAPTQRAVDHVQAAYNYFCTHWNDFHTEVGALAALKEKLWLPATGDLSQWHVPSSLFPPRVRRLIDSQAKTYTFREPPGGMAEFFLMNRDAEVAHVVDHLLWLSASQQIFAAESFEFLSWHLEDPAVEKLRNRPVYFDKSRSKYWVPDRVIFGDYYSQLGPYFGYVIDLPAPWMKTLIYLGALERLEPRRDYVTLIQDIAAKFATIPLDDNNAALLQQAYQQLWISPDKLGMEAAFQHLSEQACVMDQDRHLLCGDKACFNDRPDLLVRLPEGAVPCALYTTEDGRNFLIRMGVRPLSDLVQRHLHEVQGEELDAPLSERFRSLSPHFRRVIRSHEADFPLGWCDPSLLCDVRVLRADEIKVRYFIETASITVRGDTRSEEAWFDDAASILYLGRNWPEQKSLYALARETARILNKGLRPEVLTPVIKELLSAGDAEEATGILNEYGIAQLDLSDTLFERDHQNSPGELLGEGLHSVREDHPRPDAHVNASHVFANEALVELSTDRLTGASSPNISPANGVRSWGEPFTAGKSGIKPESTSPMSKGMESDEATPPASPIPSQRLPLGGSAIASRSIQTSFRDSSGTSFSGGGLGGHYDPPKPGGYDASQKLESRRIVQLRDYQTQREGTKHKQYKEYLSRHLALISPGLQLYDPEVATEYTFPSMDRADILCADEDGMAVPIEVETFIGQNNFVGAWQAEKYRHLASLMNGAECHSSRSILVAPSIPTEVKAWCEQHRLETREVSLPPEITS